jgi:hypothetical protein
VLVFSQKPAPDPGALTRQAARHFASDLSFATEAERGDWLTVKLEGPAAFRVEFRLLSRPAEARDRINLDSAEAANRSFGMADLARRCSHVWEVHPEPETSTAAAFYLGGILASIALGPLLPDDGRGLFGVRSCRLHAEQLAESPA